MTKFIIRCVVLATALFISIASASAALSVASQDGNYGGAVTSLQGASGMTASAGAINVIEITIENFTGGSYNSVSSVTDGNGNTYQKRNQVQYLGLQNVQYVDVEIWWAYSSGSQSSNKVTVNIGGTPTVDGATFVSFAVTGFLGTAYQTNPWDVSSSTALGWQTTYNSATGTATLSTSSVITTNHTNDLIFAFFGSADTSFHHSGTNVPTSGNIGSSSATGLTSQVNSSGNNTAATVVEYLVVSSTQTNIAASFTIANSYDPTNFVIMPDVLYQGTSGASAPPMRTLLGVGE